MPDPSAVHRLHILSEVALKGQQNPLWQVYSKDAVPMKDTKDCAEAPCLTSIHATVMFKPSGTPSVAGNSQASWR